MSRLNEYLGNLQKNFGICDNCVNKKMMSNKTFEQTPICMKKFMMDKKHFKLDQKNPITKCELFKEKK